MKKRVLPFFAIAALAIACGQSSTPATETTAPAAEPATEAAAPAPEATATVEVPAEINDLLNKHTCLTCHSATEKIIGPPYQEVAAKNYTDEQIVELIHAPKPEHWPDYPPMAPLPNVPKEDAMKIAGWINSLK
ncbi:MAG: cytochrome C [Bacteroidia bacterium]|nr:cytochrome C [Bacteroidia bacterium]MCC7534441.1 cytochrome C [Bacteroidia bacterium]MCZ2141037.1 cytochrome C [Bacteroidia bacterium]